MDQITTIEELKKKVQAFESMLAAIQTEYADILSKLAKLKAQDKTKTVTYRQLLGRKMIYTDMLSLYEIYGIIENRTGTGEQ